MSTNTRDPALAATTEAFAAPFDPKEVKWKPFMTTQEIGSVLAAGDLSALGVEERRFWSKVRLGDGGCWVWVGAHSKAGYGQIKRGQVLYAHRVSYESLVGPVAAGLTLDHLCRNRACVNPAHLEPVTRKVNNLRGESPSAKHARSPFCKRGHRKTPANIYCSPGGHTRECRECIVLRRLQRRKPR